MSLTLLQELRQAARVLRRQPGFAAAAVLMLALGVGATTAIFSVVNGVLIKPLPYPEADEIVNIVHRVNGRQLAYFNDAIFLTYAEQNRTFDAIGVWSAGVATVSGESGPEQVRRLAVSKEVLPLLGVPPERGRWFAGDEDARSGRVLITRGFWQRRFGGDPAALERPLTINGRPHQIIGVMPATFRFGGEPDIILPQRIVRPGVPVFRHQGVARLKHGVTLEQANADIGRMIPIWQGDRNRGAPFTPMLRQLKQDVVGDVGSTLWVLLGAVGIVLLMACANVANLLLVRAAGRREELGIRAALGASRARLARGLLTESLILGLLGGAAGVALAYGGVRALVAIGPATLPRLHEISVDGIALGFALAVSVASSLIFGLIPVLKHARPGFAAVATLSRGSTPARERQRSQQVLVVAQVALALVLMVSAGLMIRSFEALRRVDVGYARPEQVQTFGLLIPAPLGTEPMMEGGGSMSPDESLAQTHHDIVDRLSAIPGVSSVAFTSYLPADPDTSNRASDALEGEGGTNPEVHVSRQIRFVSPGHFRTLGTRLVAGEDFTWTDLHQKHDVAVVSENIARELWGSAEAALGRRIRIGAGAWNTIVGVSASISDNGADLPSPPMLFLPARLHPKIFGGSAYLERNVSVMVRSERAGTDAFVAEMHEAVWSVNRALPLAQVRTLGDLYDRSMARTSFTLVVLGIAGVMALVLGICGIYGVIAYAVAQRRREIGVRLALGAQAYQVRRLFVRRGLGIATAGVMLGLGAAVLVTRSMQSLLFGVTPLDPPTFAAVPVLLASIVVLATYVPARRAMRVDPIESMRAG